MDVPPDGGVTRSRLRVGIVSELPTPYRWPVFERILARPDLGVRILFCSRTESDRAWGLQIPDDPRVRFLPVRTISLRGRRSIHYHVNPSIFSELKRGRFDVVVVPGYAMFASHFGALWCRAAGVPYVMFSETTRLDVRRGPVRLAKRVAVRPLVAGASAWLATGGLSRDYLVSYGARADRVRRFPNTPDATDYARRVGAAKGRRDDLRAALGADGRPVMLFVARLLRVKRLDLLLDALSRVTEPVQLWVAGDGPEREALEGRVAALGPGRVRFLGALAPDRLPELYAAADLFVLPSDHEPWGAVVCEAMAGGLPVLLSSAVGSGPDLLREGENGLSFPAGDAISLAAAVRRLLSDPGGLRRMGARSLELIAGYTHEWLEAEFAAAVRLAAGSGETP